MILNNVINYLKDLLFLQIRLNTVLTEVNSTSLISPLGE
jgi:hypothetical protein